MLCATGSSSAATFSSAARTTSHIAQCVEFFRGSRVESYQPLFRLTSKLASPALLTHAQTAPSACPATVSSRKAHTASEAGLADAPAADETAEAPKAVLIDEIEPFWAPSLSNEALRVLLAIVSGHEQVSGLLCDHKGFANFCLLPLCHRKAPLLVSLVCLDRLPCIESVDAMMHACLHVCLNVQQATVCVPRLSECLPSFLNQ